MRSGDLSDIKRVDAAVRRWERDLPYIKRAAYGRYAPSFCFGKPGIHLDLRNFAGDKEDFYLAVESVLLKRFYQPETRRKYLSCLKRFLNWLTVPVSRVNGKCIFAYFAGFQRRNVKAATYSLHLCALRTIFDSFCDLEITGELVLPGLRKRVMATDDSRPTKEDGQAHVLQMEDIETVLQVKHSVRDRAFFCGLLLLDVKLKELLNIRKKDVDLESNRILVWGGLGRKEREVELPEELSGFFIERMNELDDGDYLFCSNRDYLKPVTGKGANKIVRRMLEKAGVEDKYSCRELQRMGKLREMEISFKSSRPGGRSHIGERGSVESLSFREPVGHLSIKIGALKRGKMVVSADAELHIKGEKTESIQLKGIRVVDFSYDGPSVRFPVASKWCVQLLWMPREVKERILDSEFKEKISSIIVRQYLEKKQTCYIRREKVNAYWEQAG